MNMCNGPVAGHMRVVYIGCTSLTKWDVHRRVYLVSNIMGTTGQTTESTRSKWIKQLDNQSLEQSGIVWNSIMNSIVLECSRITNDRYSNVLDTKQEQYMEQYTMNSSNQTWDTISNEIGHLVLGGPFNVVCRQQHHYPWSVSRYRGCSIQKWVVTCCNHTHQSVAECDAPSGPKGS